MSVKELTEAHKKEKVLFGINKVLKLAKKKKLGKNARVFVAKDCRDSTLNQLEKAGVEFEVLKVKKDISRELGIDFESEVYLIE